MRTLLRGGVSFVLVGVGLTAVWTEPAVAAATVTVGTTELGVGAYAGNDPVSDYEKIANHDGNASVTATDSDTGPDGHASGTATISSTASASKVTIAGTAATSQDQQASVDLYPAVVYLDTVLGESGRWVYAGRFDTTASDSTYDACIRGSVRVAIYPPGEDDVPDHNFLAAVNSCTDGEGHAEFGDLDGPGLALAAGSKLEITGNLTGPGSFGLGTSNASFSLEVRNKAASSVPGAPKVTGSTPSAGAVSVAFTPPTSDGSSPVTSYTAQCVSTNGGIAATKTGAASPIQITNLSAGKSYRCRVRATNAAGSGAYSAYGATTTLPAATVPGRPTVTGSTPTAGAVRVTFSPPANNGGSPITGYTAQCLSTNGGTAGSTTTGSSPILVTNLSAGKSYRCRVRATNAAGAGVFSTYGTTTTLPPAAAPGQPTVTRSTPAAGTVRVTFGPPPNNGGSPITSYTAQCISANGGTTGSANAAASPIRVTGLSAGKSYRCRVRATNAAGTGVFSAYGTAVVVS